MAEATECAACGAPGLPAGALECSYCGAPAPREAAQRGEGGDHRRQRAERAQEVIPPDLPAAKEARRIHGLAVPLVAGLVVVGIGYPLTALAVTQVGRPSAPVGEEPQEATGNATGIGLPAREAAPTAGRVLLSGAVAFEGPITPIGCTGGTPRLATFVAGGNRFSILVNPPTASKPGTYPLQSTEATFVAVSQLEGGAKTWTSIGTGATGDVMVGTDRTVSARFKGLAPTGGGGEGTIEGTVQVRCA